jgi:hypothetical protein
MSPTRPHIGGVDIKAVVVPLERKPRSRAGYVNLGKIFSATRGVDGIISITDCGTGLPGVC